MLFTWLPKLGRSKHALKIGNFAAIFQNDIIEMSTAQRRKSFARIQKITTRQFNVALA